MFKPVFVLLSFFMTPDMAACAKPSAKEGNTPD